MRKNGTFKFIVLFILHLIPGVFNMTSIAIRNLLNENRFPRGWSLIFLLFYCPFGLLLAFVRLLIFIQACLLASALAEFPVLKSYIVLCMSQVLGIVVQEQQLNHKSSQARIFVSNHITRYDQIPLHVATGCVTPHAWELPSCLDWTLGVKNLCLKQGRDMLISAVRSHLNKDPRPVLFHPEGATTSGSCGLLKFSTWPFSIITTVQPIALAIHRPAFIDVSHSVIGSSHIGDFIWFLCVPYTVFKIKYLPLMQRATDESDVQFSLRVSEAIAKQLGIVATSYTSADKAEFEKRYLMDQTAMVTCPVSRTDPAIQAMADRVAEVLPDVPLDVILKDVGRTQNVDATIANILDGVVTYTPLQTPRSAVSPATISSSISEGGASSNSFPKSAQDRMLSFQTRKAHLIESARQKYIEKNNLTVADVADFAC